MKKATNFKQEYAKLKAHVVTTDTNNITFSSKFHPMRLYEVLLRSLRSLRMRQSGQLLAIAQIVILIGPSGCSSNNGLQSSQVPASPRPSFEAGQLFDAVFRVGSQTKIDLSVDAWNELIAQVSAKTYSIDGFATEFKAADFSLGSSDGAASVGLSWDGSSAMLAALGKQEFADFIAAHRIGRTSAQGSKDRDLANRHGLSLVVLETSESRTDEKRLSWQDFSLIASEARAFMAARLAQGYPESSNYSFAVNDSDGTQHRFDINDSVLTGIVSTGYNGPWRLVHRYRNPSILFHSLTTAVYRGFNRARFERGQAGTARRYAFIGMTRHLTPALPVDVAMLVCADVEAQFDAQAIRDCNNRAWQQGERREWQPGDP